MRKEAKRKKLYSYASTWCRSLVIFFIFLIQLVYISCKPSNPVNTNSITAEAASSSQPVREVLKTVDPFEGNAWLKEGWRLFTKNGRYRLAQPDDFQFSELAKSKMNKVHGDWRYYVTRPYILWWNFGFAMIFIDTTKTDNNRFNLAIFNEPEKNKHYEPTWIIRNQDLSKTVLEASSGYGFVIQYSDDGSQKVYQVLYKERLRKYILEFLRKN